MEADRHGALLGGLYSNTARQTEFEISALRSHCKFDDEPAFDETPRVRRQKSKSKVSRLKQETSCNRLTKTVGQLRVEMAMRRKAEEVKLKQAARAKESGAGGGDLAKAIQEKLGQKLAATREEEEAPPETQMPKKLGRSETSSFLSTGIYDGPWTSKFTASKSPGALNRWKSDQRPDPAWYKVQYNMVIGRTKGPDFRQRGPYGEPLALCDQVPTSPQNQGTFNLTGIDVEMDDWRYDQGSPKEGAWTKALNWDQYNNLRVGRYPQLHYNRVSEPAKDLHLQDIKGYPKQRFPAWDFTRSSGRKQLLENDVAAPGKYDVNYSAVRGKVPSGVSYDRALPRELADGLLGHFALQAVLHPDAKRFPGGVRFDTSTAKDFNRHRITNVNDFDREMSRPNLPAAAAEYHDTNDPAACEATLRHLMNYNADIADLCVAHRRDMGPEYDHMLPRGKAAVQGLRALQTDLGVRGSVGLGFIETTGQRTLPVEKLEGRNCNAAYHRGDVGPKFDHRTLFEALCLETNFVQGHPIVHGDGQAYEKKPPPLKKAKIEAEFKRQAAKGFTKGVKAKQITPQGLPEKPPHAGPRGSSAGRARSLPQVGPPMMRRTPPPREEGMEDWSKLLRGLNSKSSPDLLT